MDSAQMGVGLPEMVRERLKTIDNALRECRPFDNWRSEENVEFLETAKEQAESIVEVVTAWEKFMGEMFPPTKKEVKKEQESW